MVKGATALTAADFKSAVTRTDARATAGRACGERTRIESRVRQTYARVTAVWRRNSTIGARGLHGASHAGARTRARLCRRRCWRPRPGPNTSKRGRNAPPLRSRGGTRSRAGPGPAGRELRWRTWSIVQRRDARCPNGACVAAATANETRQRDCMVLHAVSIARSPPCYGRAASLRHLEAVHQGVCDVLHFGGAEPRQ